MVISHGGPHFGSLESAVHSNVELSALLERSVREAVSGLALTAANYGKAIETLKNDLDASS